MHLQHILRGLNHSNPSQPHTHLQHFPAPLQVAVVGGEASAPARVAMLSVASLSDLATSGPGDWKVVRSAAQDMQVGACNARALCFIERGKVWQPWGLQVRTRGRGCVRAGAQGGGGRQFGMRGLRSVHGACRWVQVLPWIRLGVVEKGKGLQVGAREIIAGGRVCPVVEGGEDEVRCH